MKEHPVGRCVYGRSSIEFYQQKKTKVIRAFQEKNWISLASDYLVILLSNQHTLFLCHS